jgi:hypothetical protein
VLVRQKADHRRSKELLSNSWQLPRSR